MSEAVLLRHKDISGVSGTGVVGEIFEASDGAVAIRWRGEHPAWGIWPDIRDLEAVHGHQGASVVEYVEPHRLLDAYKRVVPFLLSARTAWSPLTCAPHPDHPDRLRLTFDGEANWRWWIALLDGSSDAATHEEVNGEMQHRWVSSDGNLWLIYHSPVASKYEHDPIHDPRD